MFRWLYKALFSAFEAVWVAVIHACARPTSHGWSPVQWYWKRGGNGGLLDL